MQDTPRYAFVVVCIQTARRAFCALQVMLTYGMTRVSQDNFFYVQKVDGTLSL